MTSHLNFNVLKLFDFLLGLIFVISFLNINIYYGGDVINSVWNYIWKPDKEYAIETIISYTGIGILILAFISRSTKILKKFKLLGYLGIILLWIVVFMFFPHYWKEQRSEIFNSQYLFIFSTILLIVVKQMRQHKYGN